jgi:hypothetical protein
MVAAGLSTHLIDGVERFFDTPTTEPLYDVWGPAKNDYYAVGRSGNIAHFGGSGWTPLNRGPVSDLRDVWVESSSAVAVGADGTVLRRGVTEWVAESVDPGYDLWGVWQGDALAVAVGRYAPNGRDWRQAILTNAGGGWTDGGPVGSAHRLFDVWGSSDNDVYAVGWGGEILHYGGVSWSESVPDGGGFAMLRSVSGTSPANVIAVGRTNDLRGLVLRYDGAAWTPWIHSGSEELYGVWVENATSAIAVGSLGAILRFEGDTWSAMQSPTTEAIFCVWGNSSNDVYAAGWEGAMVHFDGSSWRTFLPPTNRSINAISGLRDGGEILFVGDRGAILAHEGALLVSQ